MIWFRIRNTYETLEDSWISKYMGFRVSQIQNCAQSNLEFEQCIVCHILSFSRTSIMITLWILWLSLTYKVSLTFFHWKFPPLRGSWKPLPLRSLPLKAIFHDFSTGSVLEILHVFPQEKSLKFFLWKCHGSELKCHGSADVSADGSGIEVLM